MRFLINTALLALKYDPALDQRFNVNSEPLKWQGDEVVWYNRELNTGQLRGKRMLYLSATNAYYTQNQYFRSYIKRIVYSNNSLFRLISSYTTLSEKSSNGGQVSKDLTVPTISEYNTKK